MGGDLYRIQSRLTERDLQLLDWLADHGVLTTPQIAHALFPSLDSAQERLLALTRAKVLDRFRPFRAEGGSYPYFYALDQLGLDVVTSQRGDDPPRRDQARQRRWQLTNRANLPHLVGVNQFFTDLAGYARTHPGTRLERWWSAGRCQRLGAFAEPGDDVLIRAYVPRVRPDGHGIWLENGRKVPFFLEFDTGTEPLSTLADKLGSYKHLVDNVGRIWPVLFYLHSPVRERNLHQHLASRHVQIPVATSARQTPPSDGRRGGTILGTVNSYPEVCAAEAVWWVFKREGPLRRLGELSNLVGTTTRTVAR